MENKTKSKQQSALDQYVEFLLKVQKCEHPFIDPLKKPIDKREGQITKQIKAWDEAVKKYAYDDDIKPQAKNKIDSCLYNPEGIIYKGILYKKNKLGYRAVSDYDGVGKGTTSFLKKQGGTEYLFKRKEGGYAVVGHGLLWKTRFEKVIKVYDPLAFDPNNLDITNLDTPYKIKKSTNLVHDEPGDISNDKYDELITKGHTKKSWKDSFPAIISPKKSVNTENTLLQEEVNMEADSKSKETKYVPRHRTYNLVVVYRFEKDLELDPVIKEFIPKGTETYMKGNKLVFTVVSNLNGRHDFTDAAIRYLIENKYLSCSRQLKPVYGEVIKD